GRGRRAGRRLATAADAAAERGEFHGRFSVGANTNGQVAAIWMQNDAANEQRGMVLFRTRTAGGGWSQPETVVRLRGRNGLGMSFTADEYIRYSKPGSP